MGTRLYYIPTAYILCQTSEVNWATPRCTHIKSAGQVHSPDGWSLLALARTSQVCRTPEG